MKDNKGITLVTLVVTVVVLIVLTSTLTINLEQYTDAKMMSNFKNDMSSLREEIAQYYARNKELPILNKYVGDITVFGELKNINDQDGEYYIIDIRKLDVKLNYAKDFQRVLNISGDVSEALDVYIINKQSHTIYNAKGIEFNGAKHYVSGDTYSYIVN